MNLNHTTRKIPCEEGIIFLLILFAKSYLLQSGLLNLILVIMNVLEHYLKGMKIFQYFKTLLLYSF